MRRITPSQLQREFALSYVAAETIIREQMALARQHFRVWQVVVLVGFAANLVLAFASTHSPYYRSTHFVLPLLCIALGVTEGLIRRRAQAPILAAARAAAPAR